jgi:hypothetical protein
VPRVKGLPLGANGASAASTLVEGPSHQKMMCFVPYQ